MSIFDIFGSTTFVLILTIIIFVGIAYFVMYIRPEKRVELLRPRDSRGRVLKVTQETDLGLTCKRVGGVVHRFIKAGRGWTFNINGKMVTKFFGIEGRAYTGIIKGDDIVNVPVSEFLKHTWGPEFYSAIPARQKQAVETDVHGITIEVQRIDEDALGLPTLHADDIHDEGDNTMLRRFARSAREGTPGSYIYYVVCMLVGALTMYLAIGKGWF